MLFEEREYVMHFSVELAMASRGKSRDGLGWKKAAAVSDVTESLTVAAFVDAWA